jgi:L-ascorbate metabolism protein UlaG (beta-lactamase superfamily)
METDGLKITYIGGPTALLELGGLRLVTDPTFDAAGGEYRTGPVTLRKTAGPALAPEGLGRIDAVLLSHDHHSDNLDQAGRDLVGRVERVFTTPAAAGRLGKGATGLAPWETAEMKAPGGRVLRITGTPARHGPAHLDRGPVTGFVLYFADAVQDAIYISGDTVWYEGVAEVALRFTVRTAVLFLGAARVPEVGPWNLTMTAEEAVAAARVFEGASIVPLHYEGWEHFSESREQVERAFAEAGLGDRVHWLVKRRAA